MWGRCLRALKEAAVRILCVSGFCGSISAAGNQGTMFTKEGGAICKVAKEPVPADDLDTNTETDKECNDR